MSLHIIMPARRAGKSLLNELVARMRDINGNPVLIGSADELIDLLEQAARR